MTQSVFANDRSAVLQTLDGKLALSIGQAFGVGREVKQNERCDDGPTRSGSSLDLYGS